MRDSMTRRRVLVGAGAAATGTLGGIVLGSQNATATVQGDFQIPDSKAVLADSTLQDVRLSVDVDWSFNANARMHATELELYVGSTVDTAGLIARQTKDDLGTESLTGETTLNGSLMSAADFGIEDFRPTNGELRRTVVAELRFYVLRNEEVAVEARQQATFDVVVSEEELKVDTTLNATGNVTFTTETG